MRGALSARQSQAQAVGEVVESAPETPPEEIGEQNLLPEDDVDPDILELFLEEAEELSEAIDDSILVWGSDTGNPEHLANLLRHLHTLKGGARLVGLNSLGEFTHNFETYLISVQQNPVPLDDGFFALLNERQDEITRRVEIYGKLSRGDASEAELESMRFELEPKSAAQPGAIEAEDSATAEEMAQSAVSVSQQDLPADEIDEDILPIFIEEADELVESIDQCILIGAHSLSPANSMMTCYDIYTR